MNIRNVIAALGLIAVPSFAQASSTTTLYRAAGTIVVKSGHTCLMGENIAPGLALLMGSRHLITSFWIKGSRIIPYKSLELDFSGHPPLVFHKMSNEVGIILGSSRKNSIMQGIGYQIIREVSSSLTIITPSQRLYGVLQHNHGRANQAFAKCVRISNP